MVRIAGAYPPPPPAPRTPDAGRIDALLAAPPRVTRYERGRQRPVGSGRSRTAGVWAGTSAVLVAASVGAVVALSQESGAARLDAPLAVLAPPAAGAPGGAAVPVAAAVADTRSPRLPASDPVRVQIPALGVTSTIMRLGLEDDGSLEVPEGAYPVGWYEGGPTPGELGPSVLAGHVDWEGERGAFYGLRELRPGDSVVVDRADGTVATFRVDRVERHPKDEFPTEDVYGGTEHAGLRLVTCGGAFDEETGDYRDNVIVFASFVPAG